VNDANLHGLNTAEREAILLERTSPRSDGLSEIEGVEWAWVRVTRRLCGTGQ
jgi:hypothetical protein